MRVTYNRELVVRDFLNSLDIENYVPMKYDVVETRWSRKMELVPAVHNLIFVHSVKEVLLDLKRTRTECLSLRFMMKRPLPDEDKPSEIMTVSDRDMENFIKAVSVQNGQVVFLDYTDYIAKEGKRVKIAEGPFAGVEGKLKRIKKNKCVVVEIEGIMAVAITNLTPRSLILLD